MTVTGIKQALLLLGVMGLLTFLYFESRGVDPGEQNRTINQILELKKLILDVRQNVLLVHVGKLNRGLIPWLNS